MQRLLHILVFFLFTAALLGGQSITVVTEVHEHHISSEDSSHAYAMTEKSFEKTTSTREASNTHTYSVLKVSSLKLIEQGSNVKFALLPTLYAAPSFIFTTRGIPSPYLSELIRPPIFS